jgi:hypothetical protein
MDRRWGIGTLSVLAACGGSGRENGSAARLWPDASACVALPDVPPAARSRALRASGPNRVLARLWPRLPRLGLWVDPVRPKKRSP